MQTHIEMIQRLVNQIEENLTDDIQIPQLADTFIFHLGTFNGYLKA